jgi:hypothetical protein
MAQQFKLWGATNQKFDNLSGYSRTFSGTGANAGKTIVGIWIRNTPCTAVPI